MQLTINGVTYDFSTAQKFVQHRVKLWIEKYGTNMAVAIKADQHAAKLLADKWGVPQ